MTSDQELSVIKSRIAELKAQLNREFKEKRSSTLDKDASFVRRFFCVQDLHLYNAHVIVMNETNFSLLFPKFCSIMCMYQVFARPFCDGTASLE